MKRKPSLRDRREFIRGVTVASLGSAVAFNTTARAAAQPRSGGAIMHAQEGQRIPKTPDGRQVPVKIDSELIPGVRMSMVTEDLRSDSAIGVHLHQHEDEIIVIRIGSGIATFGDDEVAVAAGAIVYVPQGCGMGSATTGRIRSA